MDRGRLIGFGVFWLFVAMGAITAYRAGQALDWDLRNYHLFNPWALLNGRFGTDVAPAMIQTYLDPVLDLPTYFLILHTDPVVAGVLIGALQGINAWLIYKVAGELLWNVVSQPRIRAGLALGLGILSFFGAANRSEIGGFMGDNTSSIPLLLGLWLLIRAVRLGNTRLAVVALLLGGVATGLKLTNAPYAVGLLLASFALRAPRRAQIRHALTRGSAAAVGFLVGGGWWCFVLLEKFGNPLYPYFNGLFHSSSYPAFNFADDRFFPRDMTQDLFYPLFFTHSQSLTAEVPFREWRLGLALIAVAATAAVMLVRRVRNRPVVRRLKAEHLALLAFSIASYALWEYEFSIYRYAVVLEFVSVLVVAVAAVELLGPTIRTAGELAVVLVVAAFATVPAAYGRLPWQPSYFGIVLPAGTDLTNATVVTAGQSPLGYVAPYLPASVHYVRIDGNAFQVPGGVNAPLSTRIRADLASAQQAGRALYSLTSSVDVALVTSEVATYGLKPEGCQPVRTSFEQLVLCSLKATTG